MTSAVITARPFPPEDLISMAGLTAPDRFVSWVDLEYWVRANYLREDGALYWPEHQHLDDARIGFLWTNCANVRGRRQILGQAELVANMGRSSGTWARARAQQQIIDWFGELPDFLITLDALAAHAMDDASFCALIDHELCHCAQSLDEFGNPAFEKATGKPKFSLRGHDVEEFTSVVRRFGVEAAGPAAMEFILAAAGKPEIGRASIATACGTCALRIAA